MIIHIRDRGNLGYLPFVRLFGAVRTDICRAEFGPSMLVLRCWLLLCARGKFTLSFIQLMTAQVSPQFCV